MVKKIEEQFKKDFEKYHEFDRLLDKFRGQQIGPDNEEMVRPIIEGLQDTFMEMYPMLLFIEQHYQRTISIGQHYNQLIKALVGDKSMFFDSSINGENKKIAVN
jgi:hypothetical protein